MGIEIFLIIFAFLMGMMLGLYLGEYSLKESLAKKIVKDGTLYLKFKKGFETYHVKLEKKSHLSVHIKDNEIVDWKEV